MSEVRFTEQHEWVRVDGDEATIGITKYAAEQLGERVVVEPLDLAEELLVPLGGVPLPRPRVVN